MITVGAAFPRPDGKKSARATVFLGNSVSIGLRQVSEKPLPF